MINSIPRVPQAQNEPIREYIPGSKDKDSIKATIKELKSKVIDIPIVIGGKEIRTENYGECVCPHDHEHVLARYHKAGENEANLAINAAMEAHKAWSQTPWQERVAIFKKMASLLAGPYRDLLNASTMLGQSKNIFQAEIDAACELIDFFNFNCMFLQELYSQQPPHSPDGTWNMVDYRPLEGFVFAVTPFNFTSIAANLPAAPALMGNVSLWKPASSSIYSGYFIMNLFRDAGLPEGVINFIPGSGRELGNIILKNKSLGGVHFTGSTGVFQQMWSTIGDNIKNYKSYPRIVGETGGKDFILAHKDCDRDSLRTAMVRGAFEYQGQKCSAASRCYIPQDVWDDIKDDYIRDIKSIKMGSVDDFTNFMNAVIDESSFDSITNYIDKSKESDRAEIITGGGYSKEKGYFIEPTTIIAKDPDFLTMCEEIFGPVLTIYIYNSSWDSICSTVDSTSPYSLTGAIFSTSREHISHATKLLKNSAGNFYINDKPTGAVVGQQPFGGSRASGTNDKAGSVLNLIRWTSVQTIKENFLPPKDYKYGFMDEE